MRVIDFALCSEAKIEYSHVYAIGMFDGVHLGHRQVIRTAGALAQTRGVRAGVITFDRHPSAVTGSGGPGRFLMSKERRLSSLAELDPDTVVILPFDEDLAAMPPEVFVRDILLGRLCLGGAVVGENHSFGRGASGRASDLEILGKDLGFEVVVVPSVTIDGVVVSSTLIRNLLGKGDVAAAARYLGRPFTIDGTVIEGRHLGKELGFPTMNLHPDSGQAIPARGVYVVSVLIEGEAEFRWGICNVGSRPTVSTGDVFVEAHVLDFDEESYGKLIRISFLTRVRDEQRFESLRQLKDAIASDERSARRWIAIHARGETELARHGLDLHCHRSVIQ